MADKKAIVVLNIGSQRLGMARFRHVKGKLVLTDYETTEILADPAASSSRNAQIKMAVLELAQRLNVKNRVSYAVSGQSVFMRFVTLPDLDGVDVKELVAAEAQQHIPFSLEDVKWDWQEFAELNGEKEVVIAAIKSKVLNDIQDAVEGAGMYTTEVDPSPMSLYNAFKISYPDVNEPCMLIDIGAKTSNVIYIDGDRVFSRSIAIGGATVTSAIAKEYDIPFLEAEHQKIEKGVVALDTRHTSKMDEITAALATCIRTSLTRMPAEISRTTNFYRSQHNGSAPKRVYLAGGGANLPKLTTFLREKLRLQVDFFNPLRGVIIDRSFDLDELSKSAHLMGELVGLAARRTSKASLQLQLVPDSVQKEKDLDKRKAKLIIGVSLVALGLMILWLSGLSSNTAIQDQLDVLEAKKKDADPIVIDMKMHIQKENTSAENVAELIRVQEARTDWMLMLNELKQTYSSDKFWFTEITPLVNYNDLGTITASSLNPLVNLKNTKTEGSIVSESDNTIVNAIYIKGVWVVKKHGIFDITNQWLGEYSAEEIEAIEAGKPLPKPKVAEGEELESEEVPRQEPDYFSRFLQITEKAKSGKEGKVVHKHMGTETILTIRPDYGVGKVGATFEIVLPLKNPIKFNKSK